MGLGSWLCSAVSTCISAIGSAFRSVGSGIAKAVSSLAPALAKLGGSLGTALQAIAIAVEIVSTALKLLKSDETVEEIGDRALQAEDQGITLDSCKDFNDYMEKIRSLELNPEKSSRNREHCNALLAGCLTLEKGIEKLSPKMATQAMWTVLAANPGFFTDARLKVYAALAKDRNLSFGETVKNYFLHDPNERINSATRDFMWDAEKEVNPDATSSEINREFSQVRINLEKDKG